LNEIIIDQIPNLTDVLKTLEQMSIMNTNSQTSRNPFVVQQIPELRRSIAEGKDWAEIAEYQAKTYFTREAEAAEFDSLVKFADMYSQANVEALSEGFKCAHCHKPASQRCARCKAVWYCSRDCQVAHYKADHKLRCKALADKLGDKAGKSGNGGGVLISHGEVKARAEKSKISPQENKPEEEKVPKFKVEVLQSTENNETITSIIAPSDKKEEDIPKNHENMPSKTENSMVKVNEEEVNKMEELD
jgi:hypothetical protein